MKKIGVVTTRFEVWFEVARKLDNSGFATPVMWFDTRLFDKEFNKVFPECMSVSLLDYNNWCKGLFQNIDHCTDDFYIPTNWSEIKDKIKLIFNRYNAIGQFRNLDMDALITNIFINLSRMWPKEVIDCFIFTETPHTPVDLMLYEICKIKGISTLMLQQNSIVPAVMFKWDIGGDPIKLSDINVPNSYKNGLCSLLESNLQSIVEDQSYIPRYVKDLNSVHKQKIRWHILTIKHKLLQTYGNITGKRTTREVYSSFNSLEPRFWDPLKGYRYNLRLRKELYKSYINNLDRQFPEKNYLLFPLHYEPERTTVPDGVEYYDQLKAILKFRERVDNDIPIVVKEHFLTFSLGLQGQTGRSKYFYNVIKALPNTYLIDCRLNTRTLMRNALCVATISGSPIYESIVLGKPAIMFGSSWFQNAPGIFKFDEMEISIVRNSKISYSDVIDFFKDLIHAYSIPVAAHQSSLGSLKRFLGDEYSVEFEINNLSQTLTKLISN